MEISNKTMSIIAFIAALFVLFSAMIAPPISVGLAVFSLILLAAYKLYRSRKDRE